MNYFYDPTGLIVAWSVNEEITDGTGTPLPFVEGDASVNIVSNYVKDGKITPRPANPTTLEGTTLKNLPSPCQIYVAGKVFDCTDPECALDLPAGDYTIVVSAWPMMNARFDVRV
jgi:hypothetical protein